MRKPILGGANLLKAQALQEASNAVDQIIEEAKGDSEIEKLFAAALSAHARISVAELSDVVFADSPDEADRIRGSKRKPHLVVERQYKIAQFRVDFLFSAWSEGRIWRGGGKYSDVAPGWRKLVVECDGHDFHERTKEQVARDKARDRAIVSAGYDVFRFSGSEIWRDPLGCAGQVVDWMSQGW
jgi:very-short-patch-repair endonuclease